MNFLLNALKALWDSIPRIEFYWAGFHKSAPPYIGMSNQGLPVKQGANTDIGGNPIN